MLYNFIFIAVFTHSHIPCIVGHILCGLYIIAHCSFLYKNLCSWFKQYRLAVQHTQTHVVSYTSPGRDPVVSYVVTDDYIHNPKNINKWECVTEKSHYCMALLLQQFGLAVFVI